jgi:outer membrane protein assembly factor BamB
MTDDWPFRRRDAANTASTTVSGPKRAPELRWEYDAGFRIFGTPVVSDGVVYVGTQVITFDNSPIHAVDAETGDPLWDGAEEGFEIRGTPAVARGNVYAADLDGDRFTLSVSDGQPRDVGSYDVTPADGISPIVHEGTLYTNCWQIAARDPSDWAVRWETDDAYFKRPPAVDAGTVFAAGFDQTEEEIDVGRDEGEDPKFVKKSFGLVRALDRETGEQRWETDIDGLPRTPVLADGTVFVGTSGSDPPVENMSVIRTGSAEDAAPDVDPGTDREYGALHASDAPTGDERWSTRLTDPAVGDGVVCLGANESVVAYDAATGEHCWTFDTGDTVLSSPTVADGVVYVGSRDGHLYAFDLYDGVELWRFETEHAVDSNPSVVGGTVYVADNGGNVYAIE